MRYSSWTYNEHEAIKMTLSELIKELERHDPEKRVVLGFNSPHSYRGYYDELAFEPAESVTVGEMLDSAREALGATYDGYKGGEYEMSEHTDCWLAYYGSTGETIGHNFLRLILGD
jgi:hypothetical protein